MSPPQPAYRFFFLTGSYPPALSGWHRNILLRVIQIPVKAPCSLRASIEYAEQLGWNLQVEGSRGEIALWYILTRKTRNLTAGFLFI